jgi:signal transduction histidine kinase
MQFVFPSNLELGQEHSEGFHQELLRGLTHKLNNLLAVIQGFSSLILMTDDLDVGVAENMQHIREASVGVSGLSERIRAAGGCAKITPQALNLNDYLSMVELLRNAVEACQKTGGRAMLKVCGPGVITPESERRVDVLVSNTGSQIAPDKLAEVFRPFHGTKASQHLGLGLTIATMLSHQMKIQLGVASESNTTTFWLSCPIA